MFALKFTESTTTMTVVVLTIAVPALLAVMYLGLRQVQSTPLARSLAHARGDARGIALQTVIIIVVLLAIAGAVAAVLLSTGSEVASDLESADVTGSIDTEEECRNHSMGSISGQIVGSAGSATGCTWTGADVTATQCRLVNGERTGSGASTKCEVTF